MEDTIYALFLYQSIQINTEIVKNLKNVLGSSVRYTVPLFIITKIPTADNVQILYDYMTEGLVCDKLSTA